MPIVYYQSNAAVVTDEYFLSITPQRHRFRLESLETVYVIQSRSPLPRTLRLAAAVVAATSFAVLAGFGPGAAFLLLASASAVLVIAGAAAARRGRGCYELRAQHDDTEIVLFTSTDEVAFGQVKRALSRALSSRLGLRGS